MYSLLLLCVLALMWASLRLREDGGSLILSAVWVLSSAAGFLTQHLFVFPWLAIVAWLLISRGKFSRRNLAVCLLLTVALILPWYLRLPFSVAGFRGTATAAWLTLRPRGFDRTVALRDVMVQSFSGSSEQGSCSLRCCRCYCGMATATSGISRRATPALACVRRCLPRASCV